MKKSQEEMRKRRIKDEMILVLKGMGLLVLCLLLVLGFQEQIRVGIDKCLVPIFGFKGNSFLSSFFALATLSLAVLIVMRYGVKGKVISFRDAFALLLVICTYAIFRFDGYYFFEGYWDSSFSYSDGFAVLAISLLGCFVVQRICLLLNNPEEDCSERFTTDLPIESFEDDWFGLETFVRRMVKYILNTDVSKHSFSIGIVGNWGEGKSSLLNLIRKELGERKEYLVMDFRPRSSKDCDYIQEDFLDSLRRTLSSCHSGMRRTVAQYAATINVADGTPALIKWLLGLVRIGASKDMIASRRELQDAILNTRKTVAVFVDDMDRLTAKEILEVLKVIDKNGAFAGVIFITAYDKTYVNRALRKELGGAGAGCYSDKYFSVEIRLPAHPVNKILDFLRFLLSEAITKHVLEVDEKELDVLKQYDKLILKRIQTIRDAKRFVNQLVYSFSGVQDEVVFRDYFLLELIKFSNPSDYAKLYHYELIQPGFLSEASNDLWYLNKDLFVQGKNGEMTPAEGASTSFDILSLLFPVANSYHSWYDERGRRIYSTSAFEFYFFNYEYSHLTQKQFALLYEVPLSEACSVIDNWSMEEKRDLATYLLTRNLESFDLKRLSRYYQLALFAFDRTGNINYWGRLNGLIRKQDVGETIRRGALKNAGGYMAWLKELHLPFLEIEPRVASSFLEQAIQATLMDPSNESLLYMKLSELQELTASIAQEYLSRIGTSGWNSDLAIKMAQIPKDRDNLVLSSVAALRESMMSNFERYSDGLVSFAKTKDKTVVISIQPLMVTRVFPEAHIFGALIYSRRYDSAPGIDLLRAFWPIYAANGFMPVSFSSEDDVNGIRDMPFAKYSGYLEELKKIGQEIDKIMYGMEGGRNLKKARTSLEQLSKLTKRQEAIAFDIKLKERNQMRIQRAVDAIVDWRESARSLDLGDLQPGDLVTLNTSLPGPDRPYPFPDYDVFSVKNVLPDKQVVLDGLSVTFPVSDLLAIPIDSKMKDVIYFDTSTASLRGSNTTDIIPFMDHFNQIKNRKGVSYAAMVDKYGFNFVHEVQHWLWSTYKQRLKVNHHAPSTKQ